MEVDPSELERARRRYLDLLKRVLLGKTSFDNELRIRYLKQCLAGKAVFEPRLLYDIRQHEPEEMLRLAIARRDGMMLDFDLEKLPFDYTMVGEKRLENIEECFHRVIADGIPGDFIECGVWRGGAVVFMRGLLAAYEVPDRRVWVADSFQGLPPPTAAPDVAFGLDLSKEKAPMLAVDLSTVWRAFDDFGLMDDRVKFIPGWFKDTLKTAPIEQVSILRLDGDIYESTMDIFTALYDKLSPGGFCIIDDFFVPTCKQAVEEFRNARGITEPIVAIDWTGCYWRKDH